MCTSLFKQDSYEAEASWLTCCSKNMLCENIGMSERVKLAKNIVNLPIYKVIPFEYALPIILENKIRMDLAKGWDDKYELFLLRSSLVANKMNGSIPVIVDSQMSNNVFGQSWTFNENIEAAWRLYSGNKPCVRISTTIGKLTRLICGVNNQLPKDNKMEIHIGKVKYVDDVGTWAKDKNLNIPQKPQDFGKLFIESLFVKREPFKYEEELRVVCCTQKNDSNFIELPNNSVADLIDSVEFSPFLSDKEYEILSGFLNDEIKRRERRNIKVTRCDVYDDSSSCIIVIQ